MEKRKIGALEAALGRCEIHGHRGHVENDRNSFSKNWAEKQNCRQTVPNRRNSFTSASKYDKISPESEQKARWREWM